MQTFETPGNNRWLVRVKPELASEGYGQPVMATIWADSQEEALTQAAAQLDRSASELEAVNVPF